MGRGLPQLLAVREPEGVGSHEGWQQADREDQAVTSRSDDLPTVNQEFVRRAVMTLLGEQRYDQLLQGREIDIGYRIPGVGRFRVNAFLSQGDVRAVFRHIPERTPNFQDLCLPKVLERLAMERRGMILVTGITGSGKSTTLASMIGFMNRNRNDHVITIEDPISTCDDNKCVISQREVGRTPGASRALRAALREDPDIIFVGEMRDLETMEGKLHAAGDGPPRALHPAHAQCDRDREPPDLDVSRIRRTRSGPAGGCPPGHHLPAARGPRGRQGAAPRSRGHGGDRVGPRLHP